MSVKDLIKKSVLDSFGGGYDTLDIILILVIACLIGLYIFCIYKMSSRSAFYSKDLNITLAGMTIIVAAILIAMQSNLVVSLGMVGALSIVRFRNAVKSPLDLLYLFWAISAGIICGVGLHLLAIILCFIMTIMLFVLELIPNSQPPVLIIIKVDNKNLNIEKVYEKIKCQSKSYREKSCCVKNGEKEYIIEARLLKKNNLVNDLASIDGIHQINILSYDGEMRV